MFGSLTNFEGGLFDDLRRMQQDMEDMFGPRAWPTGIRSVARGTYPPSTLGPQAIASMSISSPPDSIRRHWISPFNRTCSP